MAKQLQSNEYWGRQSGVVRLLNIKGVVVEEKYFKQSQWGHGIENNNRKKRGMRQQPLLKKEREKDK